MSTRATIILKVKPEDIGRTLTHKGKKGVFETTITKKYLVKYNHWDGYPSGLGATLKENYKDYEKVLELMSGGHSSSIFSDWVDYYIDWERDEKWESNKPAQANRPILPIGWTEYAYKFENGKWYWCHVLGKYDKEKDTFKERFGKWSLLTDKVISRD